MARMKTQDLIVIIVKINRQKEFDPQQFYQINCLDWEELTSTQDHHCYKIYFEDSPQKNWQQELQNHHPEIAIEDSYTIRLHHQLSHDFQPFALTPTFQVKSAHHFHSQQLKNTLFLKPAPAFGTGLHPTTKLVAQALEKLTPTETFLDIGCGTGILSILAFKLGFKHITAVDKDQIAVQNTEENFLINEVHPFEISQDLNSLHNKKYQTIVANILAPTLIYLSPLIKNNLAANGTLLLSGITAAEKPNILKNFHELELLAEEPLDSWWLLSLRQPLNRTGKHH